MLNGAIESYFVKCILCVVMVDGWTFGSLYEGPPPPDPFFAACGGGLDAASSRGKEGPLQERRGYLIEVQGGVIAEGTNGGQLHQPVILP